MTASTGPIELAMGFDDRYAPHAAVAIRSVVAATPGTAMRFTIVHDGLTDARRRQIEGVAPNAEFRWVEVNDSDIPAYASREHFSRAILFRLGLETAAPADCKRILYIDTDVICTRDIRELWAVDMGGLPIAAVEDCFVRPADFAARWGLDPAHDGYFNSGILLIDMEAVRREHGFQHAIEFVAHHAAEVRFADQDALNFVFWGRWKKLDIIWNAQRHMALPSLAADLPAHMRLNGRAPAIAHFTGPEKPWVLAGYHPWAWLYWRALEKTAFAAEVRKTSGIGPTGKARILFRWLRRQRA